ncbi:MAG: hypothetical protein U0X92_00705 [Anaerolineales bacterium]
MNSLKSRIRTSRELAVLGLPAVMGLTIYQTSRASWWIFLPVALNLLLFIVTIALEASTSDEEFVGEGEADEVKNNRFHWTRKLGNCKFGK